jgi:elongation factor Ts
VDSVAEVILKNRPANVEEAKELTSELFADATVKMGEKFDLRRFVVIDSKDAAYIASYIHMGGKIAVAVALDKEDAKLGKGLAMHIAANNPQYLSLEEVGEDEIAHEKGVQMEAAKNDPKLANKPAEMLAKIIDTKVTKYYSEMVLGSQPYLLDDSKTVDQVLKEKGVKVLKFVRYQVGEGIEKRKDDFASEVMSQMK